MDGRTNGRTDGRTVGQTDGRSDCTPRPAFAFGDAGKNDENTLATFKSTDAMPSVQIEFYALETNFAQIIFG